MSGFHSTFRNVGSNQDFSAKTWKRFFVPFDEETWHEEVSGVISYFAEQGEKNTLMLGYSRGLGISLAYDRYDRQNSVVNSLHISCPHEVEEWTFIALEDGATYPEQSFLSPNMAWMALKEFLECPKQKPKSINWVNAETINWPESY